MIYATGDTHGNFQRFAPEHFPEQVRMTKEDYMIICGDFGGVWDGGKKDERNLDWLEELPFTTLFVSGNHENFDLLRKYPTEEWNGGKIQRIRPHVIHLMRGQVFDLQGTRLRRTILGPSQNGRPIPGQPPILVETRASR